MLYADDIVLLAESKQDLQRMLDVVSQYSRKWRFRVNPKKGKSEVMIFGRKPREKNRTWWLAGTQIGETDKYKYLGVDLVSGLNFKLFKHRMIVEARKRMMLVWAMGMRTGKLAVKDCCRVWEALVRPKLEYAAVVWGDVKWEEAEAIQRQMGKMILGCSSKMANEVVLGELGWWTLKARRDLLRIKFWSKIVGGMSQHRLVAQVYAHSRARYEAGKPSKWCAHTHAILQQLGMDDVWQKAKIQPNKAQKWQRELKEKIHIREETNWKHNMTTKPKLRTYRTIKNTLTFETDYLTYKDKTARQLMTRLRGGTNELRIETGRYPITNRDRRLEIHERRCLLCMSGDVEDERHFLIDCILYEDLRVKMWKTVERIVLSKEERLAEVRKDEEGRRRLMTALLGEGVTARSDAMDLRTAALIYCKRAMARRNELVKNELDQWT